MRKRNEQKPPAFHAAEKAEARADTVELLAAAVLALLLAGRAVPSLDGPGTAKEAPNSADSRQIRRPQ